MVRGSDVPTEMKIVPTPRNFGKGTTMTDFPKLGNDVLRVLLPISAIVRLNLQTQFVKICCCSIS